MDDQANEDLTAIPETVGRWEKLDCPAIQDSLDRKETKVQIMFGMDQERKVLPDLQVFRESQDNLAIQDQKDLVGDRETLVLLDILASQAHPDRSVNPDSREIEGKKETWDHQDFLELEIEE